MEADHNHGLRRIVRYSTPRPERGAGPVHGTSDIPPQEGVSETKPTPGAAGPAQTRGEATRAALGVASHNRLLTACLDGLMRYLLTGCRLHAERAALLLERAEADGIGDASLQGLCGSMSERLRDGGRLGHEAPFAGRGATHG